MQLTAGRSPTSDRERPRRHAEHITRYVDSYVAAVGRRRRGPRHRQQAVAHVAAAGVVRRQRHGRTAAANDGGPADRRRGTPRRRHGRPLVVLLVGGGSGQTLSAAGPRAVAEHIGHVGVQLSQRPDHLLLPGFRQQTRHETVRKQKRFDARKNATARSRQLGDTSVQ